MYCFTCRVYTHMLTLCALTLLVLTCQTAQAQSALSEKELLVLQQRAAKGDATAKYELGLAHSDSGSSVFDPDKARKLLVEAANAGHIGAALTLGYDKAYARSSEMICGKVIIDVLTTCSALDVPNWQTTCTSQRVTSRRPGHQKIVSDRIMALRKAGSEVALGVELLCLRNPKGQIAAVTYSNFAQCNECEWADYFGLDGKYIGSSHSQFQLSASKQLSANSLRLIQHSRVENAVPIIRTPQFH